MPYPGRPRTTGDLVVGDNTLRTWRIFDVGADGALLTPDSFVSGLGLKWTNVIEAPITLMSDFTLLDEVGGAEKLVMRVTNSTKVLSLVTTHTEQLMYLGGHVASAALSISLDANEHLIEASSRNLVLKLDAAKEFQVRQGSTDLFRVNASRTEVHQAFRIFEPTVGTHHATITVDTSGNTFMTNTDTSHDYYFGGGTTGNSLRLISGTNVELRVPSGMNNLIFEVSSTKQIKQSVNFGVAKTILTLTDFSVNVPSTFSTQGANNTIEQSIKVQKAVTGGGPADVGMGAALIFQLTNDAPTFKTCGAWELFWTDPSDGAGDTSCRMKVFNNDAFTVNLFVVSGQDDAVGIGTDRPTEKLDVRGGLRIDGDIDHNGTKIGYFSTAPVVRPAAYTQTYALTSRVHLALASADLGSLTGGTADGTLQAVSGSGDDATINNNFEDVLVEFNKLRADHISTKKLLNQVLDDLQAYGALQ